MTEDFYGLLGVDSNCSSADLKQSYKRLARKYHPDNKETGDENMFKKIGEAYAVLSDPQKRGLYDRLGHEGYSQGGARYGGGGSYSSADIFGDLHDVFETFFGYSNASNRRSRRNMREKGSDQQIVLEIDFLEATFGGPRTITVNRLINCTSCNGTGADPSVGVKTCTTCQGSGEVKRVTQSFLGTITQVSTCPTCNGLGTTIPNPCKSCAGKGQIRHASELELKIPKGVEDGSRLVWSQKGNEGRNGGPSGDLYILLQVKPHPRFKRDKLDIYEEININVWQAIFGYSLEVETIHGSQSVDLKAGLQPNTVISLNSYGIRLDNGQSGNHLLKINVQIPHKKDLPKELADLIKQEIEPKKDEKNNSSPFANLFRRNKDKNSEENS